MPESVQDRRDQLQVEGMTAALHVNVPLEARAEQGQVTDQIQRLVADELVAPAHALGIDDALVVEGAGVGLEACGRGSSRAGTFCLASATCSAKLSNFSAVTFSAFTVAAGSGLASGFINSPSKTARLMTSKTPTIHSQRGARWSPLLAGTPANSAEPAC